MWVVLDVPAGISGRSTQTRRHGGNPGDVGVLEQRAGLGGEEEHPRRLVPVEGLDPDPVARQEEPAAPPGEDLV